MKVSPFAPQQSPHLPPVAGVRLAAVEAGIRYKGRKDLMLALFDEGTVVAGTLTRSKTASSAVDWCRTQLRHGKARALVVNSGNANAFTGMRGRKAVELTAELAAAAAGCAPQEVMLASTGVIGEPLETERFGHRLGELAEQAGAENWQDAAAAIMTTDTFPKLAARTAEIDGHEVSINGIAKGSGMIAPDMATMLGFVFTDAPIGREALQQMCSAAVSQSFNCVTVDSDTSTSDTLLLFATGAAGARGVPQIDDADDARLAGFRARLDELMLDLALQLVKDGEGVSKFVRIEVEGAEDDRSARVIALAIANSPLVKTAFAGEDPNWGRVVMAVGKAGEAADRDKLGIWFGDIEVARDGEVAPDYREERGAAYMKQAELSVRVLLGIGDGRARVWTGDLTHGYISINADYRS